MSIESVMPPNHLILCCLLLLLPSVFPSIRVFSAESTLHIKWVKYWNFSFSVSPSNEYAESSSIRIDWSDLLAVQGTVKSLLQHHSLKASVLQHPVFFMVQLAHLYMIAGKTIALTTWTFVGKVMSLLFNILSSFVIAFLPSSIFQFYGCSQDPQRFWTQRKENLSLLPERALQMIHPHRDLFLTFPLCHYNAYKVEGRCYRKDKFTGNS